MKTPSPAVRARNEQMVREHAEGKTVRELVDKYGLSRSHILTIFGDYGEELHPQDTQKGNVPIKDRGVVSDELRRIGVAVNILRTGTLNVTITQLARVSCVSSNSLTGIEVGKHDIRYTELQKLSSVFGLSVIELLSCNRVGLGIAQEIRNRVYTAYKKAEKDGKSNHNGAAVLD